MTVQTTITNNGTIIFSEELDNGSISGNATINWSDAQKQRLTLIGPVVLTFIAPIGVGHFSLKIIQGAAGGYTISWPIVKWAGAQAPTLTGTGLSIDIVTFYFDGTDYFGQASYNFA